MHLARSLAAPLTVIALILNELDLLRDSFPLFIKERTPSKDFSEKSASAIYDNPLSSSNLHGDPFAVEVMKKEKKKMVSVHEASAFSRQHNLFFFPCSAITGEGIECLFSELTKIVVRRILLNEMTVDNELEPKSPFSQIYCSGVETNPSETAKVRDVEEEDNDKEGCLFFC